MAAVKSETERRLSFPVLQRIKLSHFSLYSLEETIEFQLKEGIVCLAGANGLGKSTFLQIGGATYETFWRTAAQPRIGFGDQDDSNKIASNVRRLIQGTELLAPELLKRFSQNWLILMPPTKADLELGAAKLGLQKLADELRMPLDYAQGVCSGQGARWLEEMMGQLMLHARQVRPELLGERKSDAQHDPDDIPDFGTDEDISPL